jgi:hypothetical protein
MPILLGIKKEQKSLRSEEKHRGEKEKKAQIQN